MANSLNIALSLNALIAGVPLNVNTNFSRSPAADAVNQQIVSVPTTAQALSLGSVANEGLIHVKNLDATNNVSFAVDNAVATPFSILAPGESFLIPAVAAATYYTKASVAACQLQLTIISA